MLCTWDRGACGLFISAAGLPVLPALLVLEVLCPHLWHAAKAVCWCAGKYLEIFGRKNNLRNYWVTLGNEVTGTGLPPEDLAAVAVASGVPGAIYGRRNELQQAAPPVTT